MEKENLIGGGDEEDTSDALMNAPKEDRRGIPSTGSRFWNSLL